MNQSTLAIPEFPHKFVGTLPRQRSVASHVEQIGYLNKPVKWIRSYFDRLHISFLIQGKGVYKDLKGQVIQVEGPALVVFRPDVDASFLPDENCGQWEEYYFVYEQKHFDRILQRLDKENSVTPVHLSPHLSHLLDVFQDTEKNLNLLGAVDTLDLIIEALFAECHLQLNQNHNPHLSRIIQIRTHLEENYLEDIDFETLAAQHGMSMITLRRHWATWVGESPNRYMNNLRMQDAANLIIESDLPLGVIAQKVGFKDPLYFSRRFHSFAGMPASDYRNL